MVSNQGNWASGHMWAMGSEGETHLQPSTALISASWAAWLFLLPCHCFYCFLYWNIYFELLPVFQHQNHSDQKSRISSPGLLALQSLLPVPCVHQPTSLFLLGDLLGCVSQAPLQLGRAKAMRMREIEPLAACSLALKIILTPSSMLSLFLRPPAGGGRCMGRAWLWIVEQSITPEQVCTVAWARNELLYVEPLRLWNCLL